MHDSQQPTANTKCAREADNTFDIPCKWKIGKRVVYIAALRLKFNGCSNLSYS